MHPIHIAENASIESILSLIESDMIKYQTKYVVVSFETFIKDTDRKKVIEQIKKHFDIFVILKSALPKHQQIIEEYFSYGVHGLYIDWAPHNEQEEEVQTIAFAAELFPSGWVFANSPNDRFMIEELLKLKVIPVLQEEDANLLQYIKAHDNFIKISRNFIKSVPLLDKEQHEYSLADKIKMKMLLETLNLRQKLMVKSVDESFNSSGL